MALEKHHGAWVIIFSFMISLMLAIMPLPQWAAIWRPDWVGLVLIYWAIATPQRVGVGVGWFVGILHDVLSDTLLGQHSLGYCLLAYAGVKLHRRIRVFPLWQQAVGIFILIGISQTLDIWIRGMLGHPPYGFSFIYPAITSTLFWPWIFILLRDMKRAYQVF
ncbi:MAG: rod shape-determining protein MreD [Thiotrichaceae bacterium]|nr:rod shape-determining protein MreD [Thiotrichaceae bacterium]